MDGVVADGVAALITPQTSMRRQKGGRDATIGILRVDVGKPRRSSGSSVEFLTPLERNQNEPPSPQPSVDRLSVTFAPDERSVCSESSVRFNFFPSPPVHPVVMEKVHFSRETTVTDGEDDEDEDYSASVSAIMQRRASTRRPSKRRSRRPSSPFSPDADSGQSAVRRRSSVFTTSSGDTAISMDEGTTQEQIYENLRLHKEVLSSVKLQPWNMRRKLRLVQQAKAYVKRHEGELQERLAQSKTTRDVLARFNILRGKLWQYLKRELANLINYLIPWELRIKEIESHFGSVVASYFTFLRWLFWVNLILALLLGLFVIMPEVLTADLKNAGERKEMLPEEIPKSRSLVTLWNFEGILRYSPIFYGYYTNRDGTEKGYRLPFAYFMTGLAVYIYSFVATLRRMAENSRMSKLSEKDDECVFTWKLLSGWDYMIGNAETAHNRVASIILGFKEALLEEAEKKKDARNWKVIGARVIVNLFVLVLLISSAYAVVEVVRRSSVGSDAGWWRQNEITVVLSLISFVFPLLFEALGLMESYHPRKQLRIQLARIMVLNLLNLYTLIFALFGKISDMTAEVEKLTNLTDAFTRSDDDVMTTFDSITSLMPDVADLVSPINCRRVAVPCGETTASSVTASVMAALMMANSTRLPRLLANVTSRLGIVYNETGLFNDTDFSSQLPFMNFTEESLLAFLNISNQTDYDDYSTNLPAIEERFDYSEISSTDIPDNETSTNQDIFRFLEDILTQFTTTQQNRNDSFTTEESDWNSTMIFSNLNTTDDMNETSFDFLSSSSTSTDATSEDDYIFETSTTPSTSSRDEEEERVCYVTRCSGGSTTDANVDWTSVAGTSATSFIDDGVVKAELGTTRMPIEKRRRLRQLCWETMFGQELVKLTVMDLVVTIFSTLLVDFFRAIFVRIMNNCWCWDLEKQFPQYGDFKIAENILHLVNNQGMVWMGMFFSPVLPLMNLVKLGILMYLRSWAVLTCNVPHEIVFRASRSNNFYFALLLTMLFLCVLPVGYAIVWVKPSGHCGPFSQYRKIYQMFTEALYNFVPKSLHLPLDYIASPGIVIPLLMLLVLIIYYLISLTGALREANNDLKIQLRRERTEERRKMFQLVDRRRRKGSGADSNDTPFNRWRKILPVLPSHKPALEGLAPADNDVDKNSETLGNGGVKADVNRSELLARIVKRAMRKSSATSDEESVLIGDDPVLVEPEQRVAKPSRGRSKVPDVTHIVEAAQASSRKDRGPRKNGETSRKTDDDVKAEEVKPKPAKNHGKHQPSNKKRASIRSKSPSTSSTNKDRGEDSQTSGWSDNIPVIKISETDSPEFDRQRAEPQQPSKSSSSDTVIAKPTVEASTGAVAKVYDDAVEKNERRRLARALLREARRWREEESRRGRDHVAMIDMSPSDELTTEQTMQEDHPEVYI